MEKQVDHQMECEIDAYSLRTDLKRGHHVDNVLLK